MSEREEMATTGRTELLHAEHVQIDALPADCCAGECDEHHDENGWRTEDCTLVPFETCVDCMEAAGHSRNPEDWDEVELYLWPHPGSFGWTEAPPAIFKEPVHE